MKDFTPQSESERRSAALALAQYATNNSVRDLGDSVFEEVTEGRAHAKGYSSCGDLAHWMLARLGVRDPNLVNRNDLGGVFSWHVGENVSRLVYHSGAAWTKSNPEVMPQPGDIVVVYDPSKTGMEHVLVVESFEGDGRDCVSHDYGQVDPKNGYSAAGMKKQRVIVEQPNGWRLGDRTMLGFIDISKLQLDAPSMVPDDFNTPAPSEPVIPGGEPALMEKLAVGVVGAAVAFFIVTEVLQRSS